MLSKFRPLVIGDCIAIAAILATTVLLDKSATRRSAQTIAEAATYIDDLQSVESNQTVTQLDDLLVEMGIGITGEAAQGNSGDNDNFELVKSLRDYFGDEILLLEAAPLPAPPELVGSYLLEKDESLERIKDLLLAMPAPVWGFDVEAVQDIDYAFLSHQNTLAIHQLLLLRLLSIGSEEKSRRRRVTCRQLGKFMTVWWQDHLCLTSCWDTQWGNRSSWLLGLCLS